jgi:hypothetical protein
MIAPRNDQAYHEEQLAVLDEQLRNAREVVEAVSATVRELEITRAGVVALHLRLSKGRTAGTASEKSQEEPLVERAIRPQRQSKPLKAKRAYATTIVLRELDTPRTLSWFEKKYDANTYARIVKAVAAMRKSKDITQRRADGMLRRTPKGDKRLASVNAQAEYAEAIKSGVKTSKKSSEEKPAKKKPAPLRKMKQNGLPYLTLRRLVLAESTHGLTLSELKAKLTGDGIGFKDKKVGATLRDLQKDGFVVKTPLPDKKNTYRWEVTQAGKDRYHYATPIA